MRRSIRNQFFAKHQFFFQQWLCAFRVSPKQRLLYAFVSSILLHSVLFVVTSSAPSIPTGGSQARQGHYAIYAMLTSEVHLAGREPVRFPSKEVTPEAASIPEIPASESTLGPVQSIKKEVKDREPSHPEVSSVAKLKQPISPIESKASGLPTVPGYSFDAGLSRQPQLLNEITVDYPVSAGDLEGKLVLRLLVSESGRLDGVAVVRADPVGVFDEAALSAFSKAEFAPGTLFGMPVKSQIFVEVEFFPVDRGNASGHRY